MSQCLLPFVDETPNAYTARTGIRVCYSDIELWHKHRGCILSVSEPEVMDQSIYDMYCYAVVRRVVVWDLIANCERHLTVNGEGSKTNNQATFWCADAPDDVQVVHLRWTLDVRNLETAIRKVDAVINLERQRIERSIVSLESPTPTRGQIWTVVKGRKIPQGTTGTLFWVGDTAWGRKIGISPSGVRDQAGKYTDAIFVALDNCRVILSDENFQAIDRYRAELDQLLQSRDARIQATKAELDNQTVANNLQLIQRTGTQV